MTFATFTKWLSVVLFACTLCAEVSAEAVSSTGSDSLNAIRSDHDATVKATMLKREIFEATMRQEVMSGRGSNGLKTQAVAGMHNDLGAKILASNTSNIKLLGTLAGGSPKDVVVNGNYAYVNAVNIFSVLDISDPTNPRQIGYVDELAYGGIALSGRYVYSGSLLSGLLVFDVLDPRVPSLAGKLDNSSDIRAIAMTGNYAYTACGALKIINVSDPFSPLEAYSNTGYAVTDIKIVGDYAYASCGSQGLVVFDVQNPSAPMEVGRNTLTAYAIQIVGNFATCSTPYGFNMINISNPLSPVLVGCYGSWTFNGYSVTGIAAKANYTLLAEHEVFGDRNRVEVVNISNPAVPVSLTFCALPDYTENISIQEDYAYVASSDRGFRILDMHDPSVPHEIGYNDAPAWSAYSVKVKDDYSYVIDGASFRVVKSSEPNKMNGVGYFKDDGWATALDVDGHYAYVGYQGMTTHENRGLVVLDVSNPKEPERVFYHYLTCGAADIAARNDYVYVASSEEGLYIFDCRDHGHPIVCGRYSAPGFVATKVALAQTCAEVLSNGVVHMIDVSNPNAPVKMGQYQESNESASGLAAGGVTTCICRYGGISVLDVSNPAAPLKLGGIENSQYGFSNIALMDHYACGINYSSNGLKVVDISSPTSISDQGYYYLPGYAWGVSTLENKIYLANGGAGLSVFSFEPLPAPTATPTPDLASTDLHKKFALAFPNPAKDEVKFLMHLDEPSNIYLNIFNLAGEKVAQIHENFNVGRGQILIWKCKEAGAGVYVVTITVNGKIVQKMKIAVIH